MRKDAIDIRLGKEIKRGTFWIDASKHFVLNFHKTFLAGSVGITVEDESAAITKDIKFKSVRVGEFGAIIGKNDRKQASEGLKPQKIGQMIENINNRLRSIILAEESQEKIRIIETKSQKSLTTYSTDDRIHLNDRNIRILFSKELEIFQMLDL